jgi:uncharacterized membrane protein
MAKADTNRNLVAALSYLLGFITGIVILLVEKEDKYVRFHAMQSTVVFGGLFIINFLIGMIFGSITVIGVLASMVNTLISLLAIVIWIVSIIKAFQGQVFKWPIAGEIAENRVK